MKKFFLLLGVGFISLQIFADPSEEDKKSGDKKDVSKAGVETIDNFKPNHTEWLRRLNDETSWYQRASAVKDWKTEWLRRLNGEPVWRERVNPVNGWKGMFRYDLEVFFAQLELKLSDKSRKVREAVVTAFEEMVGEFVDPLIIVKALVKYRSNDTDSLFLRKMKIAANLFKHTNLLTVIEHSGGNTAVLLELGDSGLDEVFEPLCKMAEVGMSNKGNVKVQRAAIQFLNVFVNNIVKSLATRLFNTSQVEGQFSDYVLKGLQIAAKGLPYKDPEVQSVAKELLRKTFETKILSVTQISQFISSVAKGGLSHSDYKMRTETIDWLLEIAELYSSLKSEIASILEARQAKESSLRMKVALKKAIRQLTTSKNTDACRIDFRINEWNG